MPSQLVLLRRLRVTLHAVVYLPLHGCRRSLQLRRVQTLLLRVRAMLGGYRPAGYCPLYAVLKVGFLLLADKLRIVRPLLVLQGAVYQYVGFCRPLKAQRTVCAFCIESDACKVVRVVSHDETLVGVLPSPLVVGYAGRRAHFVLPLLALHRHLQTLVRERSHAFRKHPEHVHHVVQRHFLGLLVHALLVHVYPTLAGGRVHTLVPFLTGCGIGIFQLLQSVQTVLVGFDKLNVRAARRLLRRHVLTREAPVLVQHLSLKPAEHALYRLRLAVVGLCRSVYAADLSDKAVRVQLLVAALVVINNLIRLVSALLDCHAVGVVLGLIVLCVADAVAQKHLAHCVDHFIHLGRPHLALLVPIVKVQLRAVTIP